MGRVVEGKFVSKLKIPVDKVVDAFVAEHRRKPFQRVLVIGIYENEGPYYAFSDPDGGTVMWDMELLKYALLKYATND